MNEMLEEKARQELGDVIQEDNSLHSLSWYLAWDTDEHNACLDGRFSADELEAIAWWMRTKRKI